MTNFQVIEAKPFHCGQMIRRLRAEQASAVISLGLDAHRELRARFNESSYCQAWAIDGRLAAIGGVTGTILSGTGHIWIAISREAVRFPIAVTRMVQRQLSAVMMTRHLVYTSVLDGDVKSRDFAVYLGFTKTGIRHMDADIMEIRKS